VLASSAKAALEGFAGGGAVARIGFALISSILLVSLVLTGCEDDPTDLDRGDGGAASALAGSSAPELED
jgi:hypothetical protein